MSNRIKALFFDFDGTFIDTETATYMVWSEIYAAHEFTQSKEEK